MAVFRSFYEKKLTQVYLNSIDIPRINEANKRIINRIGTFDGSYIELLLGKTDAVMFDERRLPIIIRRRRNGSV